MIVGSTTDSVGCVLGRCSAREVAWVVGAMGIDDAVGVADMIGCSTGIEGICVAGMVGSTSFCTGTGAINSEAASVTLCVWAMVCSVVAWAGV